MKICFYSSSLYSCHLFLTSFASVRSIPFLSFTVPIFAWNVPLVSLIFLKRSLVFPILLFSSISLHWSLIMATNKICYKGAPTINGLCDLLFVTKSQGHSTLLDICSQTGIFLEICEFLKNFARALKWSLFIYMIIMKSWFMFMWGDLDSVPCCLILGAASTLLWLQESCSRGYEGCSLASAHHYLPAPRCLRF